MCKVTNFLPVVILSSDCYLQELNYKIYGYKSISAITYLLQMGHRSMGNLGNQRPMPEARVYSLIYKFYYSKSLKSLNQQRHFNIFL